MLSKPLPPAMVIAQTLAPTLVRAPPTKPTAAATATAAKKPKTLHVDQDPDKMWNPTLAVCEQVLANAQHSIATQSRFQNYKFFVIRSLMVKLKLKPEDRSMQFLLPNSFSLKEAHEILARVAHLITIVPSQSNPLSFVVHWEYNTLLRNALHMEIAASAELILQGIS